MFYVVDQNNIYIEEFTNAEDADRFCEKWNNKYRFNYWGDPIAHVIFAE